MEAQLIQFSTVVVGRDHNPSILNPDFLTANVIVPRDWGWEVADTLTTPPFAVVRYSNGVAVSVEFDKLQVTDVSANDDPTSSKAAEIATAYVRTLPHVRYTAVGLNFQSVLEVESPEDYLKERFVKPGPWHGTKRPLAAAGIRLLYGLGDQGRVTLSLDVGETQRTDKEDRSKVVIANANFHRDCDERSACEQVARFLENLPSDWMMYQQLLAEILAD